VFEVFENRKETNINNSTIKGYTDLPVLGWSVMPYELATIQRQLRRI
jgi:hypothetical protein